MGKKRLYQDAGLESESLSESSGNSEKKNLSKDKINKKSSKYSEPDSNKEFESDYVEHKRHKHKHRKRKHDLKRSEDDASYSDEESNHHTRKPGVDYNEEVRRKHHRRKKDKKSSRNYEERETEKPTSKWENDDDKVNQLRIKSEPISDHELENNNDEYANRRCRRNAESISSNSEQRENREMNNRDNKIKEEVENKEKINFGLSGKLVEDSNTYNGIVIKYSQPPEARKPKRRWRWYIFKGEEELPFLPLHRQSAYLIGRERKVADIPTDHPSCSKQHAVIQYRLVSYDRADGTKGRTVKPYIIDLESANGTYVNNRRIDPRKYVELLEKDVVKFGYSSREYVLLHESSKDSDEDMPDTGADMSPFSLLRSH